MKDKQTVKKKSETKDIVIKEEKDISNQDTKEFDFIKKAAEYLKTFGLVDGLTVNEQKQFIEISSAYKLNPFKREVYCVPYMASVKDEKGNWKKVKKLSIIVGYEVYLKRASRLQVLDGWEIKTVGSGALLKAIITIHRKDWTKPFIHEVIFKEYNQENKMWKSKPETMLKKVAMCQGFRLCFPDEFAGLPYSQEEMPDNMTAINKEIKSINNDKKETEKKEEITKTEKPSVENDITYYRNAINKNIISWGDLKKQMIKCNIIKEGKWKVSALDNMLKSLTPHADKILKNSIETLLNNIGGK